jgi:antitoxin component of RelBE/YafQ-DinJ toxin-antitoxin module
MGVDTKKPLHNGHRTALSSDGNITALENEYSDVTSPQNATVAEPVKAEENGVSLEVDRVKETARDLYNGTELFVALGDAASWLMNSNEFNSKVRTAYMELFDFMGLDILAAVRYTLSKLC